MSIRSAIQTAPGEGEAVPALIVTHEAREMDVRRALETLDITAGKNRLLRIKYNLGRGGACRCKKDPGFPAATCRGNPGKRQMFMEEGVCYA